MMLSPRSLSRHNHRSPPLPLLHELPGPRYCRFRQEALAILESFTKTAMVIPLTTRNAYTLAPVLLDELYVRRGAPDILTAIHDALGTTRTTTLAAATANWKPGVVIGIDACVFLLPPSTNNGLSMPNAFVSRTTPFLMPPLVTSPPTKSTVVLLPPPLSLRRTRFPS
jgi:hypothetical protein